MQERSFMNNEKLLREYIQKILVEVGVSQRGWKKGVSGWGHMFKGTMMGPVPYRLQARPMVPGIYEDEELDEDEELLEEDE